MRTVRFLIAGLTGLSVNLFAFRMLYVLGVPYLTGSIAAFLAALFVGFFLQKYWTFKESTAGRMHTQLMLYTLLALCNLAINTLIVYLLVEYAGVYYLVAQAIGAGSVALVSYLVYRSYIFAGAL